MKIFLQTFVVTLLCVLVGFTAGWFAGISHETSECHVKVPYSCNVEQP